MKRLFPLLVLGLVAVSCAKETVPASETGLREISLSPNVEMKSSFERGSSAVVWSIGDRLSVLDGTANRKFLAYSTTSAAMFKGVVSSDATALTVVYPYNASIATGAGNSINVVLPEIQWAAPGKISDESILSVGRASATDFYVSMKNVAGFVSLTLPAGLENVTKIVFSANGGEKLSGPLTVSYDGSADPSVVSANGAASVSLCTPFESLAAGEYYFSTIPTTLASGFTLTFYRSDGKVASLSSAKSNTVLRNKVLDLGAINASSLDWTSGATASTRSIGFEFNSWPFDRPGGNSSVPDENVLYVTSESGYPFSLEGNAYFASSQLVVSSSYSGLVLPSIPGCRLVGVRHSSKDETPAFFFTDGDDAPVSGRDFSTSSTSKYYRINGSEVGGAVKMKAPESVSVSELELIYEVVETSPEVISIGTYNGVTGSFTFKNGTADDFEYGVSYIPSGTDKWSLAETLAGTKISSSSTSVTFSAILPSGALKARAWARPVSANPSTNRYGKFFFSSSAKKTLSLDFSDGVPFTKFGSVGGSGTLDSPRTGLNFPTAKQTVTNQTTGETSNDGGSLFGERSGTNKYWTNYPITKFNYTQDGETYQFLFGTAISLYDAYVYIASGKLYNNKARFSFPGVPGYRISSVTMNAYATGAYLYSFGKGTSYSNLGSTTTTVSGSFTDIFINFPKTMAPGEGVNVTSNNALQIKTLTIEYEKD